MENEICFQILGCDICSSPALFYFELKLHFHRVPSKLRKQNLRAQKVKCEDIYEDCFFLLSSLIAVWSCNCLYLFQKFYFILILNIKIN